MSKENSKIICILLLIFMLLTLPACKQQAKDQGGEGHISALDFNCLKIGLEGHVKSLDPLKIKNFNELQIAAGLYEGLFSIEDETGEILGILAKDWQKSDDGKVYTIQLKKEVKFHSGREMQAEDVVFSWRRILLEKAPEELYNTFRMVNGADDFIAGRTDSIRGIEILDPHTIKILFNQPNQQFLELLSHPGAAILDKEVMQLIGSSYGRPGSYNQPLVTLIGTGPFTIVEWLGNEKLIFQTFEDYHGGRVGIDRLEFVLYDEADAMDLDFQGEYLDYIFTSKNPAKNYKQDVLTLELPFGEFYYLHFSNAHGKFEKREMRQAIKKDINPTKLAASLPGVVFDEVIPSSLLDDETIKTRTFEPATGIEENTLEGVETLILTGNALKENVLGISFSEESVSNQLALKLEKQLQDKGYQTQLFPTGTDKVDFFNNKSDLIIRYWQPLISLPQFWLENYFSSWGLTNSLQFRDSEIDQLFYQLRTKAWQAPDYWEALQTLELLILDEVLLIPLYQTKRYLLWQERLEPLSLNQLGVILWTDL